MPSIVCESCRALCLDAVVGGERQSAGPHRAAATSCLRIRPIVFPLTGNGRAIPDRAVTPLADSESVGRCEISSRKMKTGDMMLPTILAKRNRASSPGRALPFVIAHVKLAVRAHV